MGSDGERKRAGKKLKDFYHLYTKGLKSEDLERLFRREAVEAYRIFTAKEGEEDEKAEGFKGFLKTIRRLFLGFTLRMAPARRVLYLGALVSFLVGLYLIFAEPQSAFYALGISFVLFNLLLALELVDKLSLKDDLEIARRIQFTLLPAGRYEIPGVIEIHAAAIPANTVGGDYYDVIELADGRLGLVIGDVSGKGIPAALLMAYLQASLRALADDAESIPDLMAKINRHIYRNTPSNSLITFFYGIFDPKSLQLRYSNAGHNRPLVIGPDSRIRELAEGGLPLGINMDIRYQEGTVQLAPGDLLFLYTDGVTEAANDADEEFGVERLTVLVLDRRRDSPEAIGGAVLQQVKNFVADSAFRDDLTMLIAKLDR